MLYMTKPKGGDRTRSSKWAKTKPGVLNQLSFSSIITKRGAYNEEDTECIFDFNVCGVLQLGFCDGFVDGRFG